VVDLRYTAAPEVSMIQSPPTTAAELDAARPLDIAPDQVALLTEEEWVARVYRGHDARQLTVRALVMGSLLGFLLAFTNLYIGLKTGWHLGVAITASILSFTLWNALQSLGFARSPMTILENNCMQSTASAAGYSTGSTMVSAIPALLILSASTEHPGGVHLPWYVVAAWTGLLALLGVSLAIPMKRNLINQERLKFPSGLAAAATLQGLYAAGETATQKGRALLGSAAVGAIFPLLLELNLRSGPEGRTPLLDQHRKVFDLLPAMGTHVVEGQRVAYRWSDWNLVWDLNPVMIAAGSIVGLRTTVSMLAASLFLAVAIGPFGLEQEWTNLAGKTVAAVSKPASAWKELGLWLGAPMMVASGLISFAMQWRTMLRAFQGLGGGGSSGDAAIEVPMSWFVGGASVSGVGVTVLAYAYFGVPLHLGLLAVVLTFALALVAARATGESDITPTGAMGKIMQLTYGVLLPQNATANLMTASITSNAASACADLLNDLKSGYLLGANPRRQFLAQAAGILSGTVATTIGFYLLVPDATALTGVGDAPPAFPAPAAQAWRAVAEVFQLGIGNLHPVHRSAIYVGLAVGAVLGAVEALAPKSVKAWLPSSTGLGLGLILPAYYALSMFVGACLAEVVTRSDARRAEAYIVPVASGLIAGISILGVVVAALNNFVLVSR
jgi:uncharacterized oligopeptide transporter (OPT) family protein